MEKLKNTPLYIKTLVLLSALLWGGSVMGQPLFNEAFDSSDGTTSGTYWSSEDTDNAKVQSNVFQLTAPSDNYSGVIWSSSVFEQVCTTDFFIKGDVVYSGSGSVVLEYSTDGSSWQEVDANGISEPQVQLQLRVDDISNGETVTLDDVKVYQAFSATVVSVKYCCNGLNDGEITVAACGGEDSYTYSWTGPDGYTSADKTITGLQQGDYTVVVTENSSAKDTLDPITIGEYSDVDVVYTVQDWSCNSLVGCNGSISLEISGGTPTYTINYSDGTTSETHTTTENHSFTGLCAGTYTINVTDANGCASTSNPQSFTVVVDETPPSCISYPDDYTMDIAIYLEDSSLVEITSNSIAYTEINQTDADTSLYEFNALGYNKLHYIFNIDTDDPDTEGWDATDSIAFYLDYDADNAIDIRLGAFYNEYLETGNDTFRLPDIADDQGAIMLYVISYAGVNKSYILSFNQLQGNNMTSIIAANSSGAGEPTGCTDNYTSPGNIIITSTDGPINWVCNEEDNQEFWFTRTYTISDDCGNSDTHEQIIGVGTAPVIVAPNDTIIDYCKLENVSIPVPDYSDNSETCEGIVTVDYIVYNENRVEVTSGTAIGESISLDNEFLSSDIKDTTFVINWTVTDLAGFSTSIDQYVTILKPITIKLTPYKTDFCSGEEVSFEFTIEGGTGSYETVQLTYPLETHTGSDGTYSFTTSSLELGASETENITINVTDSDVSVYSFGGETYSVQGGCPEIITFKNGVDNGNGIPFTIHQNISTNALERVD